VSALGINYLFFGLRRAALETRRGVAEPFVTLFNAFLEAYADVSKDRELLEVMPPFLAFRALVIGHPRWYPALARSTREALFGFARALMAGGPLSADGVPELLGGVA
jgi:hypothetical protein